jgi:hypothetical protein
MGWIVFVGEGFCKEEGAVTASKEGLEECWWARVGVKGEEEKDLAEGEGANGGWCWDDSSPALE